jgi:putative spermidine/putrescine transport system permease protein
MLRNLFARSTSISHVAGIMLLGLAVSAPMMWVFGYSLLYSLGIIGLFAEGATLQHWRVAFATGGLSQSLIYTPLVAGTSTLLATVAALSMVLLQPKLRDRKLPLGWLCLLLGTPNAVMAMMVYQVLNPGGYLARIAAQLGVLHSPAEFPVLVNDRFSVGIIIAQSLNAFPLLTLYFMNTWTTARVERYCRLAESLGASPLQSLRQVALPMLLRRGRSLILLVFLFHVGSYEVPLLLGTQAPQMFSVLTQRHFGQFDLQQRSQAFVLSTTYVCLVASCLMLSLRWRRTHD